MGLVLLGQIFCAAIMVAMAMGDDDIFDARGIETDLAQAAFDRIGRFRMVVQGIEQNDAVGVFTAYAETWRIPR